MLKKLFVCISLLCIFICSYIFINIYNEKYYGNNMGNNYDDLQDLNYLLYQSIKTNDYNNIQLQIEKISNIYKSDKSKYIFKDEEVKIINSSITNIQNVLAYKEPNHNDILYYGSQLYLAIDALSHKEQPLWDRYYSIINQDIEFIREAMNSRQNKFIDITVQDFQEHFNLIKPAILVSRQSYLVENIDSLTNALIKQNILQNKEMILNQLQASVHQVFYGNEFDAMGAITIKSYVWKASFGIGLIIFIVLSYVISRKVKASSFFKK